MESCVKAVHMETIPHISLYYPLVSWSVFTYFLNCWSVLLLFFCLIIVMHTYTQSSRGQLSGSPFASYSGSQWFRSQPLGLVPQLRSVEVFLGFPNYNVGDLFEVDHDPFLHT